MSANNLLLSDKSAMIKGLELDTCHQEKTNFCSWQFMSLYNEACLQLARPSLLSFSLVRDPFILTKFTNKLPETLLKRPFLHAQGCRASNDTFPSLYSHDAFISVFRWVLTKASPFPHPFYMAWKLVNTIIYWVSNSIWLQCNSKSRELVFLQKQVDILTKSSCRNSR